MNLAPLNGLAQPSAEQLKPFGAARFVPICRRYAPFNESFEVAMARYHPLVNAYVRAGLKVILVLTHQIGLEGQGFDFEQMGPADWRRFRVMYTEIVGRIAREFGGHGIVYQVMNEQDSTDPRASVIVPPTEYGTLFNETYLLIKGVTPNATVITGGYNSGPGRGVQQFRDARITQTDGVALHPYGASAGGLYAYEGIPSINQQTASWRALGKPLYITEFGVLGRQSDPVLNVASYARAFIQAVRPSVALVSWYDWHGGDTGPYAGYAVADHQNQVRQSLYEALRWVGVTDTPQPDTLPNPARAKVSGASVNFRAAPSVEAKIIGTIAQNAELEIARMKRSQRPEANNYLWYLARHGGKIGYFAEVGGLKLWGEWVDENEVE